MQGFQRRLQWSSQSWNWNDLCLLMNEGRFLVYAAVTYLVWEDHRSLNYLQATIYSSAQTLKVDMFRVKDKEMWILACESKPTTY